METNKYLDNFIESTLNGFRKLNHDPIEIQIKEFTLSHNSQKSSKKKGVINGIGHLQIQSSNFI